MTKWATHIGIREPAIFRIPQTGGLRLQEHLGGCATAVTRPIFDDAGNELENAASYTFNYVACGSDPPLPGSETIDAVVRTRESFCPEG
jgi:hypothetical protein